MNLADDPLDRFRRIYEQARQKDPGDSTRVALATVGSSRQPTVRMVLLKGFDECGFVFYTNYKSRKAHQLEDNPRAALCFYWESVREQVRVEGTVSRVDPQESSTYFASRSRGSQLAAWASMQSETLSSRRSLIVDYLKVKARFAGRDIRRPDFWGGYRLRPERIEFWANRRFRLHDRTVYTIEGESWRKLRLYP